MKKIYMFLISLFLFIPFVVKAETLTYNECESGCEYSSLDDIWIAINSITDLSDKDIVINFKDSQTYYCSDFRFLYVNSFTLNGSGATINTRNFFEIMFVKNISINDITINSGNEIYFTGSVENLDESRISDPEYNDYKKNNIDINNSIINSEEQVIFGMGTHNIRNTSLNILNVQSTYGDVYIDNSTVLNSSSLLAGCDGYRCIGGIDGNIHINLNTLSKNKKILRLYYSTENEELFNEMFPTEDSIGNYLIIAEQAIDDELLNQGITKTNNVYIYQDLDKTIKQDTITSEFDKEFVNTYERNIGYDDIKDLPIEWKSENEGIAKLENGVIIPVSAGNVDLVGTRGNDIYTIHLTVEKETIPEKIDKMTIKVPITGSKVKAWVMIVSILLLSVIGICSYMLIKRKK